MAINADQRIELATGITVLETKLAQLDGRIRELEHQSDREDRKRMARKERAAKEKHKPKSMTQLTHGDQVGRRSPADNPPNTAELIATLKPLATRVRGQIVIAKQKLAAL